jgi:hypothetical protein
MLALSVSTTTTFAQNDAGDGTEGGIPSTLQALSKECPTEMALILPCIDTNTDFTACTECVSVFITQNADILNSDEGQSTSTSNAATDTSATCDAIDEALCKGIQECGTSCGLTNSSSFFTFGSSCDSLFGNLVACVLQSQNIGTDCDLKDVSCSDGQVVEGNAAASIAPRDTVNVITSLAMGILFLSLWM